MSIAGFRSAVVFKNATEGVLDDRGNFLMIEVTNDNDADTEIHLNEFEGQGHMGVSIPVKAKTTRQIPLAVYRFRADHPVTVVAYRM